AARSSRASCSRCAGWASFRTRSRWASSTCSSGSVPRGPGFAYDSAALLLAQIASSVTDLRRTQRWYRDVLGLEPAGGTNLFAGPVASMVQGVPRAASTCWWLVDRQDQFQLELFEFRSPPVRRLPPDWRPCDV